MKENMLTDKQEKYVQNLIKGMSQREAYRDAYPNSKMNDDAVDVEASRLLDNPKVALRHKELRDKVLDKSIMTARERMKWLSDVINGNIKYNDKEAYITDKIKALDTLNKMTGEYTQKVEVDSSNFEINIKVVE